MKVLIITDDYCMGGAENHGFKLAKYLKKNHGIDTQYWVFREGDGTVRKLCLDNDIPTKIVTEFYSFRKFPNKLFQIRHHAKAVKEFNPNAIISFNTRPNIWNGIISKYAKVKCSIWSQQSVPNYNFIERMDIKAVKHITCFISNAHHVSNKMEEFLPIKRSSSDLLVVHNGIENIKQKESNQYWSEKLNKNRYHFHATMVANLTTTKIIKH